MPSSYSYVNWQPDDEVVSSKLKQMSDNDQWIHDNIVTGDLIYRAGVGGILPQGRTVGSQVGKDIYGIYVPFDSLTPVSYFDVVVTYPPVFTTPPICMVTIANGFWEHLVGNLFRDGLTTEATYRVFRRDGAAVQLRGALNVLLFGT